LQSVHQWFSLTFRQLQFDGLSIDGSILHKRFSALQHDLGTFIETFGTSPKHHEMLHLAPKQIFHIALE
jgi:hypothetical protein